MNLTTPPTSSNQQPDEAALRLLVKKGKDASEIYWDLTSKSLMEELLEEKQVLSAITDIRKALGTIKDTNGSLPDSLRNLINNQTSDRTLAGLSLSFARRAEESDDPHSDVMHISRVIRDKLLPLAQKLLEVKDSEKEQIIAQRIERQLIIKNKGLDAERALRELLHARAPLPRPVIPPPEQPKLVLPPIQRRSVSPVTPKPVVAEKLIAVPPSPPMLEKKIPTPSQTKSRRQGTAQSLNRPGTRENVQTPVELPNRPAPTMDHLREGMKKKGVKPALTHPGMNVMPEVDDLPPPGEDARTFQQMFQESPVGSDEELCKALIDSDVACRELADLITSSASIRNLLANEIEINDQDRVNYLNPIQALLNEINVVLRNTHKIRRNMLDVRTREDAHDQLQTLKHIQAVLSDMLCEPVDDSEKKLIKLHKAIDSGTRTSVLMLLPRIRRGDENHSILNAKAIEYINMAIPNMRNQMPLIRQEAWDSFSRGILEYNPITDGPFKDYIVNFIYEAAKQTGLVNLDTDSQQRYG